MSGLWVRDDFDLRFPEDGSFSSELMQLVGGAIRNEKAYMIGDVARRIWDRVTQGDGCWLWPGYLRNGYGVISIGGEPRYVHRVVALLYVGELGPGLEVCHHCDVGACTRPRHLFIASHAENMDDAKAKGRLRPPTPRYGVAHHGYRITDDLIAQVRQAREAEGLTQRQIATRFGINQSSAWNIYNRRGRFA